ARAVSIRVLVVDDSAFVQKAIARMLADDGDMRVVAYASDGEEALAKLFELAPDVVTLDLRMPRVHGLEVLRRVMRERPTPVIVLSSYTRSDASLTIEALALGAVDFVDKSAVSPMNVYELAGELKRKIRIAARSRPSVPPPRLAADGTSPAPPARGQHLEVAPRLGMPRPRVVVIGASTGGPSALQTILSR